MIDHQNTIVVIPARMASTRLPGKPMADINGLPMIVHVWRRAIAANLGHVLVAAAETEIANAIRTAGGDAIVTEGKLASGSARVAAALALRDRKQQFAHVVNLRGDLPGIASLDLQRCLAGLTNPGVDISTIAAEIKDEAECHNPNVIKAVAPLGPGREVAFVRDFLRQLPAKTPPPWWRHVGIYAYQREALERFAGLPQSAREKERSLEQMRALDHGMKIAVVRVDSVPLGVDTPAGLERARQLLKDNA